MTIDQMREALLRAYPNSKSWPARVKAMPDDQIFAIYTRMKLKNQL